MYQIDHITSIDEILSGKTLVKLATVCHYKGTREIADIIRTYIADEYNDMYSKSSQMTLREFFINFIDMLQDVNCSYDGFIFTQKEIDAIKAGNIEENIEGFSDECEYPDALILKHSIECDVKMPVYNAAKGVWETTMSTNVYFETPADTFMYISAINSIKTLNSYVKYKEHLKETLEGEFPRKTHIRKRTPDTSTD